MGDDLLDRDSQKASSSVVDDIEDVQPFRQKGKGLKADESSEVQSSSSNVPNQLGFIPHKEGLGLISGGSSSVREAQDDEDMDVDDEDGEDDVDDDVGQDVGKGQNT